MEEEPAFELAFELTADDLTAYAEHVAATGAYYVGQMQSTRRILVAICAVLLALFALVEGDIASTLIMGFALSVAALVLWVTWPRRWRAVVRKQSLKQAAMDSRPAVLGPKRYKVDREGITFSGVYSGGYALWPAITRISSDESAAYLHLSEASAHILPRRAFETAEQFTALVANAEQWRARA